MGLHKRIVARYVEALVPTGEEKFGRFNVKYLAQHAKFVPNIGAILLEAEQKCASAGYPIPHEIVVVVGGQGVSKAGARYYSMTPPTMQIAAKSFGRADLIHTVIHELGHYFHDQVVSDGWHNATVIHKYMWAIRQKRTGEGSPHDVFARQVEKFEALLSDIRERRKQLYTPKGLRKGAIVEYTTMWYWNRKTYQVKGRVLGKAGRDEINIEVLSPPEFQELVNNMYHRGNAYPEKASTFTNPDPAQLEALNAEEKKVEQQKTDLFERDYKQFGDDVPNTRYTGELQHDWVPTTYSRTNPGEWFAEMFTTDVLGRLKPEVSEWMHSVVKTGEGPKGGKD